MDLLVALVYYALVGTGAGLFLRALPWPAQLLNLRLPILGTRLGEKPLMCPVCMSGWGAILALAPDVLDGAIPPHSALPFFAAAIAVGAPVFAYVYPAPVRFDDIDKL